MRVRDFNVPALAFWTGAIRSFLGRAVAPVRVEGTGRAWLVSSFDAKPPG